jgi:hypothetical protein
MNLSTIQPNLVSFAEILDIRPSEPGYLNAVNFNNPKPTPLIMLSQRKG